MTQYLIKLFISAAVIATVTEVAKRNNFAASIIHSLPLTSLLAFIWLYVEQKDAPLIARHSFGTFWFVLPTLPMFLILPWMLRHGWGFWTALGVNCLLTTGFFWLTVVILKRFGVHLM